MLYQQIRTLNTLFSGKSNSSLSLAEYSPLKAFAYQAQVGMVGLPLCLSVSASGPCQGVCATWRFSSLFGAYSVLHPLQLPYTGDVACLENSKCSRLGGKSV